MLPVYAGCGGAALADGPLPVGEVLGAVTAAVALAGAVVVGIFNAATADSKEPEEKDKSKGDSETAEQARKNGKPRVNHKVV